MRCAGRCARMRLFLSRVVRAAQAYSKAADVFSFAVVLWELAVWQLPWEDLGPFQARLTITRSQRYLAGTWHCERQLSSLHGVSRERGRLWLLTQWHVSASSLICDKLLCGLWHARPLPTRALKLAASCGCCRACPTLGRASTQFPRATSRSWAHID